MKIENTMYIKVHNTDIQHSSRAFCGATPALLLNFLSRFSSAGGDVDEERLSGERFRGRLMNVVNMFHIACTCGNQT